MTGGMNRLIIICVYIYMCVQQVNYVKGSAKLVGPKEVEVLSSDGSITRHQAKNIIIASGSQAISIPGIEVDEEKIVSSAGALSLSSVPRKMIVIGAGVIGLELGSVWRRFGAQVTFVEFLDKAAFFLDDEIGAQYTKLLQRQGMKFNLGTKVVGVDTAGPTVKVHTENAKTGKATLEADVVLMSVGRRPNVDGLGIADLGIETDRQKRIVVNDHWETNVEGVYAIGDVVAGPMLAHKAEEEGIACVEHIVGKTGHVNYDCIPGVIFTHPEVAWVGKTEQELKEKGVEYKVGKFLMQANSRARSILEADGMVKVLTDAKTDRILGMHILGGNASEQIAECVLAMEYDASSEDVARTCHAHPTLSEAVKEACLAAHFKPIHM
jgi:dihydrolipoamide dehydrogenase